jgi:predicted Fe-S protein YdhL (DUF1289 family)
MIVSERPVSSPCVNTCQLNADDICEGCYRSVQEIGDWMMLDNEARKEVLRRCVERRKNDGMCL